MSVIEIKGINKSYGHGDGLTQILKDVSLSVENGEFVAITGPSGSGKTTLMNIIGLLDVPDQGAYFLDGVTVANTTDKDLAELRLKHIGFVFQSFNLIPSLNARDNVELPMVYGRVKRTERRQRATQLLELMGLGDRMTHRPNQLSGGQMQRVAIARALANQPSLILADEPTGNLDSATGKAVMDILKQLNGQGVTVVMITHDPSLAQQARRVIAIRDGMVVQNGGPVLPVAPVAIQNPVPITIPTVAATPIPPPVTPTSPHSLDGRLAVQAPIVKPKPAAKTLYPDEAPPIKPMGVSPARPGRYTPSRLAALQQQKLVNPAVPSPSDSIHGALDVVKKPVPAKPRLATVALDAAEHELQSNQEVSLAHHGVSMQKVH